MRLTEFLLARIADDEAWAAARSKTEWHEGHIVKMADTAVASRLRKDCEAKRRIVENPPEKYDDGEPNETAAYDDWEWTCKVLATVYADHPDYRPEWKP